MKLKLRIAVTIGVAALLLYAGVVSPSAGPPGPVVMGHFSWAYLPSNIEHLCTAADIIVIGTITAIKQVTGDNTDFVFTVEQVLKGPPNLEEVIVRQMGAHGKMFTTLDPLLLNVGGQYVLFLAWVEGAYKVFWGPYGRFPIIDGKVFSMAYIFYPELLNYDPEDVIDYLGIECEMTVFYLNTKGIDKQAFAGRVIDAMESGVKGYVAGISPYGETLPLERARVEVDGTWWVRTYTDENGYYEIFLAPGTYTLTVTYFVSESYGEPYYNVTYYNVQVVQGEFATLNFVLELEPMYVELPVVSDDPDPVPCRYSDINLKSPL